MRSSTKNLISCKNCTNKDNLSHNTYMKLMDLFNRAKTGIKDFFTPQKPISPLAKKPEFVFTEKPKPTPPPGLSFDQLLEGYGKYGATPGAQAVQEMVKAQDYPVFRDNPALLPAMSIIETSAGKNMTRPRNNPQNLMNWGIYTDFEPRDQAHSVSRAASGIGERFPYYQKFRDTGNLEEFVNTYAPASDGNEGYLDNLLKAMQYFQ